jgi:hypothetical protein
VPSRGLTGVAVRKSLPTSPWGAHTIVVGGLAREGYSHERDRGPERCHPTHSTAGRHVHVAVPGALHVRLHEPGRRARSLADPRRGRPRSSCLDGSRRPTPHLRGTVAAVVAVLVARSLAAAVVAARTVTGTAYGFALAGERKLEVGAAAQRSPMPAISPARLGGLALATGGHAHGRRRVRLGVSRRNRSLSDGMARRLQTAHPAQSASGLEHCDAAHTTSVRSPQPSAS